MEGWDCIFCVFCALLLSGSAQAQVTPNSRTPSQLAASRKVPQGKSRLSSGELPTVRPAVTTVSASLSLDDSRGPWPKSGAAVENDLATPRSRRKDRRGHKTSTSLAHGGPDRLSKTRDADGVSRLTDAAEYVGTRDVISRTRERRSVGKSQREKISPLASGSAWNASTENVTSRAGGVAENGSAPLSRHRDPIYWPWGPGLKHNKTSHDKPDGAPPSLPSPGASRESNSSSSGERRGGVFWPWGPNGDAARNVSSTDRASGDGSAGPGSSPGGSRRGAIPWPWGPADKDRRRGTEAHDHSAHSSDPHPHGTESSAGTSPPSGSAGPLAGSRHVHHAEVPELDDVRLADASVVVARAEGMYFIQRLFQRYSGDRQGSSSGSGRRGGVLTVRDLASLLDSIGFRRAAADKGEAAVATTTTTPHQHPAHEEPPLYRSPEDVSSWNKGLHVDHSHCLSPEQLLQAFHYEDEEGVDYKRFLYLCPALLYQLDSSFCLDHAHPTDGHVHVHGNASHAHPTAGTTVAGWKRWLAGMGAVLVVSLVGLASVFAVQQAGPAVRRHLLPFLVALAVGALSGDALLHLLPHVLASGHEGEVGGGGHREGVWRGLAALTGLLSFWLLENLCRLFQLRKLRKKQARKLHSHALAAAAAARLARPGGGEETKEDDVMLQIKASPSDDNHTDTVVAVLDGDSRNGDIDGDEHHGNSHEHTHAHGHAHSMPEGVAAILSMVVLGDGIHNLLDGLAIGVAFAAGLTSGLSTALAVLCHELPHEIGDFAMLLSAGMPVRRALLFNCVSSLLCLLGCGAGLGLGNMAASLTAWLLAAVAGLFLYIALVTMLPQLKEGEEAQGCGAFLLRMSGILMGSGIMLTIALFEEQLKTLLEA